MDMTMSNARPAPVEVLISVQQRRRWTPVSGAPTHIDRPDIQPVF